MQSVTMVSAGAQGFFRSVSMGVKLIVVCVLALIMMIPALFVGGLIRERSQRADTVTQEISADVGGAQTFLGPTLVIPYRIPAAQPASGMVEEQYLVFPEQGNAVVRTATEERHRSLFRVPVFQADLQFEADFAIPATLAALPSGAQVDWSQAEVVVGVSDPRGALADATLAIGAHTVTLTPAGAESFSVNGDANRQMRLTLLAAPVSELAKPGASFHASARMRFSGAERFAVLAYGKSTHVTAEGDWRNPDFSNAGFAGSLLPVRRNVSDHGFTAEWSVPFIARGVPAEGPSDAMEGLGRAALGVSFVELADPYQSVSRSLKYVLLFVGLVFLSYFAFEATTGKRVHPAQYLLVGIAQLIFYLLLLSLAERIGFGYGFLLAGAATVSLLAANAAWIFASRLQGVRALGIFSLLYALIYLLLTLEDNALLVGAVASFLAVAAAMYLTRNIDWHSAGPARDSRGQIASPEQTA